MNHDRGIPLAYVFGAGIAAPDTVPALWPAAEDHGAGHGFGHESQAVEVRIRDDVLIASAELGARELRKMDRMAVLALSAARRAWRSAGCTDGDREMCGIMSGNTVAGWTFTEPQLRKLYSLGVDEISPYLASTWFPAASQGQISIHLKLRGYAKTIATDRCAGTQAVGLAAEAISECRGTRFLAGAAEAPLTDFVTGAAANPAELAEGAAYLVLGPASPNRDPIAAICAHSTTVLPERPGERLACCLQLVGGVVQRLGATPGQADLLVDSAAPADRALLTAPPVRQSFRRAWWVGDYIGDTLAATGPIATAALCGRYAAQPGSGAAVLVSLGIDFATAIAIAAISSREPSHVAH